MKAAVITNNGHVAVNFDCGSEVVIFSCGGDILRFEKPWQLGELLELLDSHGVEVLICGGIKKMDYRFFVLNGIEVIPWVRGSEEEVIDGFCGGFLNSPSYFMPGCFRHRRGRRWRKF